MATKKNRIKKMLEASIRVERKEQGFFDGRFSTRSYRSKKTYTRKTKHK
jgi:hypothetical protein